MFVPRDELIFRGYRARSRSYCVPKERPRSKANVMSTATEVKQEIVSKFQTHKNDTGSSQVQIALLTQRIADLTEHFKIHKKDNNSRRGLLKLVSRRRKLLDYLKREDINEYHEIIQKLGLRK